MVWYGMVWYGMVWCWYMYLLRLAEPLQLADLQVPHLQHGGQEVDLLFGANKGTLTLRIMNS